MNRISHAAAIALFILAAFLLPSWGGGRGAAAAGDPTSFQPATACAQCHPEIYRTWRSSKHASSFSGPAFQLPYERIRRSRPEKAAGCEQCHNPVRFLLASGDPRAGVFALEGVTCDFCHSVESVGRKDSMPRFKANPAFKFGPRGGEPGKSVHVTKFSRLHITSEFCEGCHEFRNEFGVKVLSTYSEWADSFYRGEGVHCQFCHLPQLFDARFIDPGGRGKGPLDHSMAGGHSRERMAKAISLRASLKVSGREARVNVQLKNDLVGHMTPSGMPTHRLRLSSLLFDASGTVLGRKEEVFERVLGDGTGKPLEKAELIFTSAREVLKDSRIRPKETREITHVFPFGDRKPATAEVALAYEIPTPDIAPELLLVSIPVSRVVIPAKGGIPVPMIALIALAAVVLLLAAAVVIRRRGREKP
ncbi:MAG TPA: multiheme c-type cytochrome [Candidatus Deferrimicrobiaceae bacterium]